MRRPLISEFAAIEDPRCDWKVEHRLVDILVITVSVAHGPVGWSELRNWAAYHLRCIAENRRVGWQKASGYNRRSKAEAAIARWKQVSGDELRAHADERRAAEVDVAAHALNRMLGLGRPTCVRLA